MDRRIGTLVLATGLVVFGAPSARAQQGANERQVKAANQAFYEAIVAHDLGRMDAVWAHEPYVRTIHPGNSHADAGWEAVRVGWQKLFERSL